MTKLNLFVGKLCFSSRRHLPADTTIDVWKETDGLFKGIIDWKFIRFGFWYYSRNHSHFYKL